MPVNAGIQVRFGIKFKDRLDSAFAGMTETESTSIDKFRTTQFGADRWLFSWEDVSPGGI